MDEELNSLTRRIVAELQAQRFVIDYLLRHTWALIPRAQRLELASNLLDASERTDHISGAAEGDELKAANMAEITERMQTSIDQYVGRALKAIGDVEDAAAAQHFEEDRKR